MTNVVVIVKMSGVKAVCSFFDVCPSKSVDNCSACMRMVLKNNCKNNWFKKYLNQELKT